MTEIIFDKEIKTVRGKKKYKVTKCKMTGSCTLYKGLTPVIHADPAKFALIAEAMRKACIS